MYLCLLIVPSTVVTCTVRALWQVMLTIRWSLGHTHSREPASSLERLVKVPRFAPKTTCFFSWNDFIPLTINIQPDLTYNSLVSCFFLLPFLPLFYNTFAALFVEHLFGSVLSNYPKGYYGLSDQALQKTCYLCSRPLRDLFFMLPFFLNHTITSETVPRRKFSVSAKYYNVHACPLFFIDLIMFHVWVQFFTYFCYLYNCM